MPHLPTQSFWLQYYPAPTHIQRPARTPPAGPPTAPPCGCGARRSQASLARLLLLLPPLPSSRRLFLLARCAAARAGVRGEASVNTGSLGSWHSVPGSKPPSSSPTALQQPSMRMPPVLGPAHSCTRAATPSQQNALTPFSSTSAAALTCVNRAAACGDLSTSGWHARAARRKAAFTSSLGGANGATVAGNRAWQRTRGRGRSAGCKSPPQLTMAVFAARQGMHAPASYLLAFRCTPSTAQGSVNGRLLWSLIGRSLRRCRCRCRRPPPPLPRPGSWRVQAAIVSSLNT